MNKHIRILLLEAELADARLIAQELRLGGITFSLQRVDTRQYFQYELENHTPDLILADHEVPSFGALPALAMAQEKCPDVPFIVVTRRHGEDAVVEALKKGATDYVLKNQLARLAPSVRCALRESEGAQRKYRDYLQLMAECCSDALFATTPAK